MQAPSVMFIEAGADTYLKRGNSNMPPWLRDSQRQELQSFGDQRAKDLGATGLSADFQIGYELGLATARTMLTLSVVLAQKGVKADDVL